MGKPYIKLLAEEGYDVGSEEALKASLLALHNANANVWECVKHARDKAKIGAVGSYSSVIDDCVEHIQELLLK